VYRPIGLEPDSFTTLRTWERGGANNGTAFGGYGMLLTPQGTARLGRFLMEGGQIAGEQVLEPSRLRDMMFENPADRGAPMDYGLWHYNNGMWGYPLDAWGCDGVVPFLFGVSGVTVALAPNGVVYFAYNDTYEQPVTTVLDVIDAIAPLCP
jgi:CubicO group peptidase (beta-lactamase class C family)